MDRRVGFADLIKSGAHVVNGGYSVPRISQPVFGFQKPAKECTARATEPIAIFSSFADVELTSSLKHWRLAAQVW